MIIRLICLCGLLLLAQAEAAFAAPSPRLSCSLFSWKNVERFESLSAMRPEVVKMLLDRLGSQANAKTRSNLMAERDAIWADEATPDSPLPSRRFIYGLRFGNRWIVWYERGGKTHSSHLVIYDFLPAPGRPFDDGGERPVPGHPRPPQRPHPGARRARQRSLVAPAGTPPQGPRQTIQDVGSAQPGSTASACAQRWAALI